MPKEPIPEIERECSEISYKRRGPLPKKQDREPSPVKFEADLENIKDLVERSNEIIEIILDKTKSNSEGHAKYIKTEDIVIDHRARWKCRIPVCFGYNMSLNCPPNSPKTEEMKEIVSSYEHAILVSFYPPVENHVFPGYTTKAVGDINLLSQMVGGIEAEATYYGYYLAMGFGGGPCVNCGFISPEYLKEVMQGKKSPICPALDSQMCSQFLRARPSLEACGVDVFKTVYNCGEKKPYVINPEHSEDAVPYVGWHGIVFII